MHLYYKYQAANTLLQGRLNSAGQFRKMFKVSPGDLCDLTATKCGVCDNLLFLLFGYDAPQVNNVRIMSSALIQNRIQVINRFLN